MPLDPSIPLSVSQGPFGPNMAQVYASQNQAYRNALQQQDLEGRNALRNVFSNPNALDPSTGLPLASSMAPVLQADPGFGLQFMQTMAQFQEQQQRANVTRQLANSKLVNEFDTAVANPLINFVDSLDPNISPEQRQILISQKQHQLYDDAQKSNAWTDEQRARVEKPYDPSWKVMSQTWNTRQKEFNAGWEDKLYDYDAKGDPVEYSRNKNIHGMFFKPDHITPYQPSSFANPEKAPRPLGPPLKAQIKQDDDTWKEGDVYVGTGGRISTPGGETLNRADVKDIHSGPKAETKPKAGMYYVPKADGSGVEPKLLTEPTREGEPYKDQNGNPVAAPTGKVPPSSPDYSGQTLATPSGNKDLTGEAYLKTLDPREANLVKMLAEGKMQVPSWALRSADWQKRLADTAQYDPSFDTTDFNRRNREMIALTSGKQGDNISYINNALGHSAALWHTTDELAKTEWGKGEYGPWVNWPQQKLTSGMNPELKAKLNAFNLNANALADELERAFRGTGGNVSTIEGWRAQLNSADTPKAVKASIKKGFELLASRIDSIYTQAERGIGPRENLMNLFTPGARKTFEAFQQGKEPPSSEELAKEAIGRVGGSTTNATPPPATPQSGVDQTYNTVDEALQNMPEDNRRYEIEGKFYRRAPGQPAREVP